jgi:hypothetical protein
MCRTSTGRTASHINRPITGTDNTCPVPGDA